MAWPEISIEDFPPERDDEPSSLRQDIIDELSDHFTCALSRELLKNPDKQTAKQRVLNQFGDPIKIARQLWLDAMKEKIMTQRIMAGVSVAMAVCGFIVVGLVWSMMNESQTVNARIVEQLDEIAKRPQPIVQNDSSSEEMTQVSFQLVQGNKGGKPVIGFNGKLTKTGDKTDSFTLKEVSDKEGKLEFGKLPWGGYSLILETPWGEYYHTEVTVVPGRNYSQTIVCPVSAPIKVPVRFHVNWPDYIKSEDWLLLCDFRPRPYPEGVSGLSRKIGKDSWTRSYPEVGVWDYPQICLIDKQNHVFRCPLTQNRQFKAVDFDQLTEKNSVNMIEADEYSLPVMYLLKKQDLVKLSNLNMDYSYPVLSHSRKKLSFFNPERINLHNGGLGSEVRFELTAVLVPFAKEVAFQNEPMERSENLRYASGVQLRKLLVFTVAKDRENVWEIKIPELNKLKILEGVEHVEGNGAGHGFF